MSSGSFIEFTYVPICEQDTYLLLTGYCHRSGAVEYDFPSLLAHSCLNARKLTELAAYGSSNNVIFFAGTVRFAEKIYILLLYLSDSIRFSCHGYSHLNTQKAHDTLLSENVSCAV